MSTADSGKRYRVVVTAAGVSVNSSAVTLTVTDAVVVPSVTVAPGAQSVTAPTAAAFSVTATGTALSYQWQRSTDAGTTWQAIAGATSATYDTGATSTTMNDERFRVVVSNSASSVTSAAATLSVVAAPSAPAISIQPSDQSAVVGASAAFSVAATGTPEPTLQWQRSTDAGVTWVNISGATASTYNTGAVILSRDGERYRAVVSNSAGTVNSSAVRLSVTPAPQAPAITTQPSPQSVTAPTAAIFTAAASGVPTPTWQWQMSTDGGSTWANVNGATAATYTTPATVIGDSGKRFRAVATNASGSATTASALLNVLAPAPTAQWGTPTRLQNNGSVGQMKVAPGANGEFVVVWLETGSPWSLRSQRYLPGSGWAPVTTIDTSGATPTGEYDVAMNPAGSTATVVWTNGPSAWFSQSGSDGVWSSTQALPAGGNYPGSQYPRVTMDSSGGALAAWVATNNPSPGVYLFSVVATQFLGPTNPIWSAPVAISAPTDRPDRLMLKGNANGDAVAAWVGNNAYTLGSLTQQTIANVLRSSTGWDGPTALTDASSASQGYLTDVAINAAGVAAVAYNFTSTTPAAPMRATIRRYSAGAWGAPNDPVATPTTFTSFAWIALDTSGLLTAAWNEGPFSPKVVSAARETSPGNWGSLVSLTTNGEPAGVLVDSNGNALTVWVEPVGGYFTGVKSARLAAGASTWSNLTGLPGTNTDATAPTLAANPNGDIVAAWFNLNYSLAWANILH